MDKVKQSTTVSSAKWKNWFNSRLLADENCPVFKNLTVAEIGKGKIGSRTLKNLKMIKQNSI